MLDKCTSEACAKAFRRGERIIQLTSGTYLDGYITPFLNPEDTHNWHPECFREFPIKEQRAPYSCANCHQQLGDRKRVLYACRGAFPGRDYIRAESRGYVILYIAHLECPEIPCQTSSKKGL